jgi:membrane protease YdiL (CAAX protease family)
VAIVLLDLWVFAPRLAAAGRDISALHPPAWQGLLASFYGAIPEELLTRLGLMTLLVWIGTRLTRASVPRPAVVWTAIVITALLFGAGHLPTTATVLSLTPLLIARALVLNGIGGIVFGWLYWVWPAGRHVGPLQRRHRSARRSTDGDAALTAHPLRATLGMERERVAHCGTRHSLG